jgi:PAS domain S-box-containing protein
MSTDAAKDSPLRIVRKEGPSEPLKIFCGHCGRTPDPESDVQASRVCSKCGMGLLLQAPAETAPSPKDPFIVVDGALTVCALSRQAEKLLGLSETEVVNRHIADFLVPADSETATGENLASLLAWAARGETPSSNVVVRPTNTFGVRYWARVGPCGPPNAALLVLADAR